jgi:hypothetical protein
MTLPQEQALEILSVDENHLWCIVITIDLEKPEK